MQTDILLSSDAVRGRLARELPAWQAGDGVIVRTYRTSGWKSSLMVVNAIGHVAESAWHHPDLEVSWGRVTVRLSTHSAGGVTEKDLALAARIEDLVTWTPGDGSPLDGVPDDPRYRYLDLEDGG